MDDERYNGERADADEVTVYDDGHRETPRKSVGDYVSAGRDSAYDYTVAKAKAYAAKRREEKARRQQEDRELAEVRRRNIQSERIDRENYKHERVISRQRNPPPSIFANIGKNAAGFLSGGGGMGGFGPAPRRRRSSGGGGLFSGGFNPDAAVGGFLSDIGENPFGFGGSRRRSHKRKAKRKVKVVYVYRKKRGRR